MRLPRWTRIASALTASILCVSLTACAVGKEASTDTKTDAPSKQLKIVATTGYLGDAVKNIAPDAEITVLVAPGGDPHTQSLTTQNTQAINDADLVVWTSHDMEHKMMDQLDNLGDKQIPAAEAIPESDLLPWEEDGKVEGHDPHVWNSPDNWTIVVTAIANKLATIDSANADTYRKNAEAYNKEIIKMKDDAKAKLSAIPAENRVLITGHDAFNYLGKTFDIEIHATDFVSSEAQISAAEMDELASLIVSKKIKTIFQDNLANPDAINHLKDAVKAKGWEVQVSNKPLYADSLGESAPTNTYLGAFQYNIDTIVEALAPRS